MGLFPTTELYIAAFVLSSCVALSSCKSYGLGIFAFGVDATNESLPSGEDKSPRYPGAELMRYKTYYDLLGWRPGDTLISWVKASMRRTSPRWLEFTLVFGAKYNKNGRTVPPAGYEFHHIRDSPSLSRQGSLVGFASMALSSFKRLQRRQKSIAAKSRCLSLWHGWICFLSGATCAGFRYFPVGVLYIGSQCGSQDRK